MTERGEDKKPAAEEEEMEEGDRDGETPRRAPVEAIRAREGLTPPQENADFPDFSPEHAHLLLQGFYIEFPYHNDGLHLDKKVTDDAIWKSRWRRLAM